MVSTMPAPVAGTVPARMPRVSARCRASSTAAVDSWPPAGSRSRAAGNESASARSRSPVAVRSSRMRIISSGRGDRLRAEGDSLTATRDRLTAGGQESTAAVDEARQRADTLGILAGTVPATGPGIVLTITDPQASVRGDVLLDTMEELRDAGAEAMSVSGVRVVTSTYFLDRDGGVEVDGRLLRPPYVFLVIGDPRTLAAALDIPGGVLDTVRRRPGASAAVEQQPQVDVTALRALVTPRYARPAAAESGSIG